MHKALINILVTVGLLKSGFCYLAHFVWNFLIKKKKKKAAIQVLTMLLTFLIFWQR